MKQQLKNKVTSKNRDNSLDILRGIAVVAMILAHTIAFFHTQESEFMNILKYFGDTITFTTFLLVSGAVLYFAYISIDNKAWKQKRSIVFERIAKLLIGYYVVAIISTLRDFPFPPNSEWIFHLLKIFLFVKVPGYTEFLIPFIFYAVIIVLLRKYVKRMLQNELLVFIVALVAYACGSILYRISIPLPLHYYVSLLAGEDGWYRFPLLQYTPVLLLGLIIGKRIKQAKNQKSKFIQIFSLSTILFVLMSITLLIPQLSRFPYSDEFQRWPPSLGFLLTSLAFACMLLTALNLPLKQKKLLIPTQLLVFFGRFAFGYYIYHIIILQLEHLLFTWKFSQPSIVFGLFLILLILCSLLLLFRQKYVKNNK